MYSPEPRTGHGMTRRQLLALGAAGAAALSLDACGGSSDARQKITADPDDGWAGTLLDPPFPKPDAQFTDFNGKPFLFVEATKDRLTVLFFGYTNCPDVCPTYLNTMAAARRIMGSGPGSEALTLFVGVDVARDTPPVLKQYLGNIDPTFVGLTGTEKEIDSAIRQLKLPPTEIGQPDSDGNYAVGHPARVFVFSPDNKAHRLYTSDVRAQEWAQDLPRLASGKW